VDLEVDAWLDQQQRQHNLASFRWPEKRLPKRHKFEPWQLAAAIRSLEKAEQHGKG